MVQDIPRGEGVMTDSIATAPGAADHAAGEIAVPRLADPIASMASLPLNLTAEQMAPVPQLAPAEATALSTSAAIAAPADRRARRSPRPVSQALAPAPRCGTCLTTPTPHS